MEANKKYPEARELTYAEFPMKYVWKKDTREFVPRKQRFSIGRIFYVPPGCGDMYYLRCLLNVNRGATCYDDMTRANGVQYHSLCDVCYSLELLNDDKEYNDGIIEASHWASAQSLRVLLATLLSSNCISRPEGEIVLNVASSGIASLLLPGGRTTHSRFEIPFNPNEKSTCNIKQGSPLAEINEKSKLIIWDEATMMHKFCFEALDKSMKDIMRFINPSSLQLPFGGKTVVLGGNFRQILPVIPRGSGQDIVLTTINSSYKYCNDPIASIVESTFSSSDISIGDTAYFQQRAILAPTLDVVQSINEYMISLNHSEGRLYLSSDIASHSDKSVGLLHDVHTPEYLNGIKCFGVPNHKLNLKVGTPVMLLRNVDHFLGLCNDTRLIVTMLGNRILEGQILTGSNAGHKVLIPILFLTPSDPRLLFKFQRRRWYPLIVSYAMTINKS
ncbi:uncharacterized protein [Henckelia pumila]|uniref:uncharacterized protein n=1 Tax=Henckelia pumila TaxID=405737 RepID=UPI003C6DCBF2